MEDNKKNALYCSHCGALIGEDEDYEEEYNDEEADDYEIEPETSRARYESESYEARRASSLNMMDLNDL